MLRLEVEIAPEAWDSVNEEFIDAKFATLELEHSLVSIDQWESKWNKPFFSEKEKTSEETFDYIKCMTLNTDVDPDVYNHISESQADEIIAYLDKPMTATNVPNTAGRKQKKETVTSELIYYWMIAFNIPIEFKTWHINKLLTLIRVCDVKNTPPKKGAKGDTLNRYLAMNDKRLKQHNMKG